MAKVHIFVFWLMTLCCLVDGFLHNVSTHLSQNGCFILHVWVLNKDVSLEMEISHQYIAHSFLKISVIMKVTLKIKGKYSDIYVAVFFSFVQNIAHFIW